MTKSVEIIENHIIVVYIFVKRTLIDVTWIVFEYWVSIYNNRFDVNIEILKLLEINILIKKYLKLYNWQKSFKANVDLRENLFLFWINKIIFSHVDHKINWLFFDILTRFALWIVCFFFFFLTIIILFLMHYFSFCLKTKQRSNWISWAILTISEKKLITKEICDNFEWILTLRNTCDKFEKQDSMLKTLCCHYFIISKRVINSWFCQ